MTQPRVRQGLVLGMSTLAFTVCFMVWMMFAVLGVPIKELLQLNETQFGLLAATPVLTGSLVRLPLGLLTDRFGGRIVMAVLIALNIVGGVAYLFQGYVMRMLLTVPVDIVVLWLMFNLQSSAYIKAKSTAAAAERAAAA